MRQTVRGLTRCLELCAPVVVAFLSLLEHSTERAASTTACSPGTLHRQLVNPRNSNADANGRAGKCSCRTANPIAGPEGQLLPGACRAGRLAVLVRDLTRSGKYIRHHARRDEHGGVA